PAMGSGHILVYAFDVLYEIYLSAGYSEREIPTLILEKNLYGLDIDDRAGQLATFALLMKARSKNRRIFRRKVELNVCSIQESNGIPKEAIDYLVSPKDTALEKTIHREDVEYLIEVFTDAKEYGSILDVKKIDFDAIERRIEEIRNDETVDLFDLQYKEIILEKLPLLIKQGKIMSEKYDVVCANPPYSGFRKLNDKLKSFIEFNYRDYKYDLFSVFMVRNINFAKQSGYLGLMTPDVWQFIVSYENLRNLLIDEYYLLNLIQLEEGGFKDASVSISTYIIKKKFENKSSIFIRLQESEEKDSQSEKVEYAIRNKTSNKYEINIKKFKELPNSKIAYWVSQNMIDTFKRGIKLGNIGKPRQGMATSDNNRFLRCWFEVNFKLINFKACVDNKLLVQWVPYNKGGGFRKWYGNNEYVINWENDGYEVKQYAKQLYGNISRTIKNEEFYFRKGITYSFIGKDIGPRFTEAGFIFDVAGSTIFIDKEDSFAYILGILASKLSKYYMDILNPTINIQVGDLKEIPIINIVDKKMKHRIESFVNKCIEIAKNDWNSFETSWDFKRHPLINGELRIENGELRKEDNTIESAFNAWNDFTESQFNQLKANEEELNRIFIEIYGLQDELTPEVADEDITISKADRERDIKSFISYAVGCMFGRYSLDEEGLIYAGGDFDDKFRLRDRQWEIKTKEGWKKSRVNIVEHNVIPIADGDYFEDGILERFVDFVKVSFGEDTLEENLDYIAETLGRKANETSRQAIRRYFLKDFYKDHVKTYKKRPIYWLFDSGRQDGFKALIYMHRYDPSTVARVRTDYL
ncbi:MAG: BREX-1 system adenine-specific DNA-methyltransferase PglX, partial [Caldicoprobacterales bacterium]